MAPQCCHHIDVGIVDSILIAFSSRFISTILPAYLKYPSSLNKFSPTQFATVAVILHSYKMYLGMPQATSKSRAT